MASSSRSAQFTHVHKVLKRHYKPVSAGVERPVLEHLLFACCLEDAHYDAAEEAFAALVEEFFDWNEIRVSTVRELAEVMARLPNPPHAAGRLKRVLQHVFEATYSFDLEPLCKKNLGPAIEDLKKIDGTTGFSVAYVVQSALGGHAIAVDSGTLQALHVVDLITDADLKAEVVPGLERAISKSKGVEFGSLLHQLGADFTQDPYSPAMREKLLEIEPGAKSRLPKRRRRRKQAAKQTPQSEDETKTEKPPEAETKAATGKHKKKHTEPKKKSTAKKRDDPTKEKTEEKTEEKTGSSKTKDHSDVDSKKSASSRLAKRKPR